MKTGFFLECLRDFGHISHGLLSIANDRPSRRLIDRAFLVGLSIVGPVGRSAGRLSIRRRLTALLTTLNRAIGVEHAREPKWTVAPEAAVSRRVGRRHLCTEKG